MATSTPATPSSGRTGAPPRSRATAASTAGTPPAESGSTERVEHRILRGAAQAFGQYGYNDTSVETILACSGVSRRTFYRAFRSKEHVFEALFARSAKGVLEGVSRAVEEGRTPREKVEGAVAAYLQANVKAGALARVLLLEQFGPGSPLSAQRERVMEAFTNFIGQAYATSDVPLDPIIVRGVVAGLNAIAVQMASEYPAGNWDVGRARAAMLRILRALSLPPAEAYTDGSRPR